MVDVVVGHTQYVGGPILVNGGAVTRRGPRRMLRLDSFSIGEIIAAVRDECIDPFSESMSSKAAIKRGRVPVAISR